MDKKPTNRHERRRQRTREKLKQAALTLLLEKNYEAITIQNITDEADLGRGTFYIHFKDKEDVVWAIIQDGIETTIHEAIQQTGGALPPQAEFLGYYNIFQHANQHRDLYRIMLGSQGSATLTTRVQDFMAEDFLNDMRTMPIYTGFDLPQEILAQVITGAVVRLVLWWLETPNNYTPEQMAKMLYRALHHQEPPESISPAG
jgi:AcrR family transcriptional regulator